MKKNLLLTFAVLVGFISMSNAQEKKWFVETGVNLSVTSVEGESASSIALGAGIHRMLGKRVSLGVNMTYSEIDSVSGMEVNLACAYYGRFNDSFYFVPQMTTGPIFYLEGETVTGFSASFSPFGLEFRPTPNIGFRTSIVNLTYVNFDGISAWNFSIRPGLSMIIRF